MHDCNKLIFLKLKNIQGRFELFKRFLIREKRVNKLLTHFFKIKSVFLADYVRRYLIANRSKL